jgi:F-type H+-transporting ATPase subunit b
VKRFRPVFLTLLLAGALLSVAAHPVLAAEGGEETSGLTLIFQWINFAVVAGVVGWLLVTKTPKMFAARATQISSAIDDAQKMKAQADALRREAEQRLANLSREIEELRAAAARDAAAEAQRIQAATKEEAAKIDRSAHIELEAAARGARIELRALATRLSIARAEALLRADMTPTAEDGMFAAFLGDLSGRRN